jgi:endoglucanase
VRILAAPLSKSVPFAGLLCLALLTCSLPSEANAQLSPADAARLMGRGINLGNTLEPYQEGGWNNGPAQEVYFDAYAAAGFQTVRIPVRWDGHTSTSSPYTVSDAWMDRVE